MSSNGRKAKALGVNHVVLEVGDLDQALEFYGAFLDFELRGRNDTQIFIDMGDQFLQFSLGKTQGADDKRHFGLVVDQRETIRAKLEEMGVELLERGLNFRDPWGNRIEIVPYEDIQFTKLPSVLAGMGAGHVKKTPEAIEELAKKGMSPE